MKRISIIFLISFAIQLSFILSLKVLVQKDACLYDDTAINLIAGKGVSGDGVYPTAGYVKYGYIFFLAFVYKIFSHSIFAVKIIQAILISSSCIMVYKIGNELFNEHIGYYSALITALHPAFLIISSHILSESLFVFLLTVAILYLVLAMKRRSLKLYLLSGIFLGMSTQVRFTPIFLPLFIFAGLLLFYKEKLYALKASVIIALSVIVISIPWCIRDYIHFKYFNPFVVYGGVLWLGSFVEGHANHDSPEVKRAIAEINRNMQEYYSQGKIAPKEFAIEREKLLLRLAFDNIKKQPLGYIALFPRKILRLWIGSYSGLFMISIPFLDFMKNPTFIRQYPVIFFWKSFVASFSLAVFCLGIIGMISGLKMWRKSLVLYLIVGYFTLLHIVVFSNTRLGIPALPYMIIFATIALFKILEKRKILC